VSSVDFKRDVRPILSDTCFTCHGPDEKRRMIGLRLDTPEGPFQERDGYRLIVPGDPAASRLYQRISAIEPAQRMPPPMANRTLTAAQVETIRRWIEQGAKWETHWAYSPPKRPDPPAVKNKAWSRNPIDQFILARLERDSLKPSPEAGKAALLRRVTYDLTGLPPSPAEINAFLADNSHGAYEKVVDRLLDSPRYGERMAMQWLDVARYADTHGYHIDSHRDMWPWRDWLIQAFNRNMSFDQFTVEQLAGDLLPGARLEQRIATGFNRNHMINFEGGAIPEEYLNEYVVDRVETTSTAWLGMTMGCARCHDHKYDPISQKEFYRFYAFFNNVTEKGLDGRKGNAEPFVQIPTPEQEAELERVRLEIREKDDALCDDEIEDRLEDWQKTGPQLPESPREGLIAHYDLDGSLSDLSGSYRHGRTLSGDVGFAAGPAGRAADFDGQTHVDLGAAAAFDRNDSFSLAFWLRPTGRLEMAVLHKSDPQSRRGYELTLDESQAIPGLKRGSHLYLRLVHALPGDAIEVRTRKRLVQGAWQHVAIVYDGSGKAAGVRIYVDGRPEPFETLKDSLTGSIGNPASLQIGAKQPLGPYKGQMDDLRIYSRMLQAAEIEAVAVHEPARATLRILEKKRSKDQRDRLREYFLTYAAPELMQKLHAELKVLTARKERLDDAIPTAMVMNELAKPRETFVLGRGDYRNKGEKVSAEVPACLPPMAEDLPRNRLGLAKWLLDPSHPLTSRVAVNRYWQMYFGHGLVKTAEDFGSQGEPPSHPELLDWLATEFIRTGWDIKKMQRLIVTSAAYRQSSRVTPKLLEKDPENRLLARGPRFRLSAEMIRDGALAASGLLHEKIGGPGVFPYQPEGLWDDIAYGDVYSAQTYTPGHGKDLYRRSMYSFWKRTMPPPGLITFDAPDREKCTARRTITNTPLQALVLMNDPTYVEAARALAQRTIREAGDDPARRIGHAFRLAAGRTPTRQELRILRDLVRRQSAHFSGNVKAALAVLRVGESPFDKTMDPVELASWTVVASTILNLDETITKE
jgi:hypothetical protein